MWSSLIITNSSVRTNKGKKQIWSFYRLYSYEIVLVWVWVWLCLYISLIHLSQIELNWIECYLHWSAPLWLNQWLIRFQYHQQAHCNCITSYFPLSFMFMFLCVLTNCTTLSLVFFSFHSFFIWLFESSSSSSPNAQLQSFDKKTLQSPLRL